MNTDAKKEYEARKAEKEKQRAGEKATAQRPHKTGSTIRWAVGIAIIVAIGYWFYSLIDEQLPQGEDFSVTYEEVGREHIALDPELIVEYNSNPPSSGSHYSKPAVPGDYTDSLPDKVMIHNLEHGDIWITYQPHIDPAIIEDLKRFNAAKVIATPRPENETDVALVAWKRVDAFNLDETDDAGRRAQDFITRYINRGPERIPAAAAGHNGYNPETGE